MTFLYFPEPGRGPVHIETQPAGPRSIRRGQCRRDQRRRGQGFTGIRIPATMGVNGDAIAVDVIWNPREALREKFR